MDSGDRINLVVEADVIAQQKNYIAELEAQNRRLLNVLGTYRRIIGITKGITQSLEQIMQSTADIAALEAEHA